VSIFLLRFKNNHETVRLKTNPGQIKYVRQFRANGSFIARGHQNKRRPPWWVVGQRPKKDQVQNLFVDIFMVFSNYPRREKPKNVIKQNREKLGFGFFPRFFGKNFSTRLFRAKSVS
jgi:hypothetical protein